MLQRARRAAWFTNNAELVAFAAWNAFFMYLSYEFYTCVYRSIVIKVTFDLFIS